MDAPVLENARLYQDLRRSERFREHVLDSFWGFTAALGIEQRVLRWDLPLPPKAVEYAERLIPEAMGVLPGTLLISPCSSHVRRKARARAMLVSEAGTPPWSRASPTRAVSPAVT